MNYWWAILGGGALAYGLTQVTSRLRQERRLGNISDQEWLARVVIMEHSRAVPDEWTAIMQVVINRLGHPGYPDTIREVVATHSWPGGGARASSYLEAIQADGGMGYESAHGHHAPPDNRNWQAALEHAGRFLNAEFPNRIGTRVHQCHPGRSCGYPDATYPDIPEGGLNSNGRLKCISGRLIPLWALPLSDPDSRSEQEPVVVGSGIFS